MRPGLVVLFMSGYTDASVAGHGMLDAPSAYVQKPFTAERLSQKIREVLDARPRP